MNTGLGFAAQQVQAAGRQPDTQLAHISPSEAQFIDYLQGGRKTNPLTGLPEYSMFGDILKAVARAAGAIGGFMVGGPAGAAAGSGIATKLTGGSWKDALTGAALSGVGSWGAQALTGGGTGILGSGGNVADTAAMQSAVAAGAPGVTPSVLSGVAPGIGGQFMNAATSWPGIAAGLGANMANSPAPVTPGKLPPQDNINLNVKPQPRTYNPYPGDPLHFAEPVNGQQAPGTGWEFYSPLNPQPIYMSRGGGVRRMALGGPFAPAPQPMLGSPALSGPQLGGRGADTSGIGMPGQPGAAVASVPAGGVGGIGHNELNIRRAAMMGYMGIPLGGGQGMAHGGIIRGPQIHRPAISGGFHGPVSGPGTGVSDSIPAMLSTDEHVLSAQDVANFGGGSSSAGHDVIDNLKHDMRVKAGFKNPNKSTNGASINNSMIARAQRRAGVV